MSSEKIRGNTRINWKIGERALEDYHQKDRIISRLKILLSTGENMFEKKIGELAMEISLIKQKYNSLENKRVETRLAELVKSTQCQILSRVMPEIVRDSLPCVKNWSLLWDMPVGV